MSAIIKSRLEMVKLAREWRSWSNRIAEAARRILGECEVYVFGSVAEGRAVGGSDVDILIVSANTPEKNVEMWRLKAMIEEEAGLPLYHPYEIHLASLEEAKRYYRHIKGKIRIA